MLSINGPGRSRAERRFRAEDEVQAYQIQLAEEFSAAGFVLIGENFERRAGGDRRKVMRGPDRRAEVSQARV